MDAVDRRQFLQMIGFAAGAVALGGCRRPAAEPAAAPLPALTPGRLLGPDELEPAPRPTLRLAGGDLGVPSPFGYAIPPGYFLMILMYDTLLWTDSTGALVPWLAADFQRADDGLTYTFQLRDGVRWHDGQPLTAEDVAFTFDYFAAHKNGLSSLLLFTPPDYVAEVRATDERTVAFRLDIPAVTFAEEVAGRVPIVPRHIWADIADPARVQPDDLVVGNEDNDKLVGSGPYRLESYTRGQGTYAFTANDDFFLGTPFVERLEARPVSDPLTALLTGDIDITETGINTTPRALRPFVDDDDFGVVAGPPNLLFALYWNLAKGGALGDVRFRQACALAIDRRDLVDRLAEGNGEPGNPGFLPEDHPYRVDVEQYRYDLEEANRLLDEAGYARGDDGVRRGEDGQPLSFRLDAPAINPGLAQLVAQSLEAIGVKVDVNPVQFVILDEDADMAVNLWGGHADDPDLMRRILSSDAADFRAVPGYANDEFDELAARQLVAFDEDERKDLVAQMQHIVAADLPMLHLYYPLPFTIHRKEVFDQVASYRGGLGALNKQVLVTGVATGGTDIRPIAP